MPKILRYLIKVSTLLSNVRFSASFRRLEESIFNIKFEHVATWIEKYFFRKQFEIALFHTFLEQFLL